MQEHTNRRIKNMKKRFWSIILMLFLAFAIGAPASAALQDMQADVYKWDGQMGADGRMVLTKIESGITFQVLAQNSDTAETLYYPGKFTSLTNPVSATNFASASVCNKRVAFRVDPTDTTYDRYVDLIVVDTAGGYTAFVEDFDIYTHTIVIDERPNIEHHNVIWFNGDTTNSKSTGVTLLAGMNVRSVQPEIVTTLSGHTMSVGHGTVTAFINLGLLTTAGHVNTSAASTGTALGNGTIMYPHGYHVTADTLMYYTVSSTTGTPAGYIHYYVTYGRK
jgi:hypothetical protein